MNVFLKNFLNLQNTKVEAFGDLGVGGRNLLYDKRVSAVTPKISDNKKGDVR